jgi:hypothetical protein
MKRTRSAALAVAALAAVSLTSTAAVASVPPPDAPYSPYIRHGDEYRAASSSCVVDEPNHSLRFVCAAGQTGTVTYGLRVDHSASLRFRMTGNGLEQLSTRKRNGRWYVTIHVGEGTTTIVALDSFRAS